jgi:hypothetical protein
MTDSNFESMTRRELRNYILENRNDDDAFRAYMDRLEAIPNKVWHPAPKSIDDLSNFPQLLEEHRQRQREQEEQE